MLRNISILLSVTFLVIVIWKLFEDQSVFFDIATNTVFGLLLLVGGLDDIKNPVQKNIRGYAFVALGALLLILTPLGY
ncbi:hypothetical protein [Thalassobacillus pellis]|uniref:hypothetical protein n=1 Tax=Thalassobacillus pellis TaxID=748008 RepID=UPI001961E24F|nr:hypothetical protein [Thalassobacillus pellis]MBM7553903.1 UDP-N-acetylmuramyl pentapeptide phosphotransferase/UDP-N-acetylglucosamine-1-phosphate transferase [Thalassobacillus pellis]